MAACLCGHGKSVFAVLYFQALIMPLLNDTGNGALLDATKFQRAWFFGGWYDFD
jgi:hypothetical protein